MFFAGKKKPATAHLRFFPDRKNLPCLRPNFSLAEKNMLFVQKVIGNLTQYKVRLQFFHIFSILRFKNKHLSLPFKDY